MANKLFRQQAIDTLDSPDRINDYIRVAGPSFYLMLVSILICVGVAFFWIFSSTINDFVKIEGIAFPHKPIMHVSSSLDGRITELFVSKGDHVHKGDVLLRYTTDGTVRELRSKYSGVVLSHKVQQEEFTALEPCVYLLPEDQVNQLKEIVAFVSYADLRKLKVGMEVQVTPSDLKREEVGYMYGHITSINDLPTSAKEADMLFKISEFTSAVFSSEAAFMIQIRLEDSPRDKNMIRWSHIGGEEIDMKIGTLCSMQIVTRVRPAYELLFKRGVDN